MSLKEVLFQDLKEAMKEKDVVRKDTIQIVRAGILQIEKDEQIEADDVVVLTVVSKELKKRKDVLADFEKAGRQDLVDTTNKQIVILNSYLPKQLSEDELTSIIKSTIDELNASSMKDMGSVISAVVSKVQGQADNKTVSTIVKSLLS